MLEQNSRQSTRNLAGSLQSNVFHRLENSRKVSKIGVWVKYVFRRTSDHIEQRRLKKGILELECSYLLDTLYSPDIAPTDYRLFCFLQIEWKNHQCLSGSQSVCIKFLSSIKTKHILQYKLPGKCETIFTNSGEYIINYYNFLLNKSKIYIW